MRNETIAGRQRGPVAAILLIVASMMLFLAPVAAFAAPTTAAHAEAAAKALDWTASQQLADGSFPGFGVGSTADAVYALAAGGRASSAAVTKGLAKLETDVAGYAKSPGAAAKIVLALAAAGKPVGTFGGVDLLGVINGGYNAATGQYGADVTGHTLAILALKASGQAVPAAAAAWLIAAQAPAGGWAYDGSTAEGSADTNTSGLAVQALAAFGGDWSAAKTKASAYFKSQQNADGGYAFQMAPGNDTDANSTAAAIMGIIALGENPEGAAWTTSGANPVSSLLSLQNASGALRYQAVAPEDNGGATYQAIPALLAQTYPVVLAETATAPGMPRTGNGFSLELAALALVGGALALLGLRARRVAGQVD